MLVYAPLTQIDDNPFQARTEYGAIDELAGRIAVAKDSYPDSYGLMQIPRGRIMAGNGLVASVDALRDNGALRDGTLQRGDLRLQLAFGHRRLRAFRHLHESGIDGYTDGRFPVHVDGLTDDQMLDAVWSENRERKDISAVEEAELLARKLARAQESGGSQRTVAEAWGLARATVTNRLRLLQLPEDVQAANRDGRLSERQCLALLPIVRIEQSVNGSVKWNSRNPEQVSAWETPAAPTAYIEHVVASGKITSDDIRDYTKQAVKHAGNDLPDMVAAHKFPADPPIRQEQCKGCAARVNSKCLDSVCFKAKVDGCVDICLAAASADLNLPISKKRSDFVDCNGTNERHTLRRIYKVGGDSNLVVGWLGGGYGVRPYCAGEYLRAEDAFSGEKPAGIVVGYRGTLPDGDAVVEDIASKDAVVAWNAAARKIVNNARAAAKAALTDAIEQVLLDTDILQALIAGPYDVWNDDPAAVAQRLIELLYIRGAWAGGVYNQTPLGIYENIAKMLDRAGVGRAALSSGVKAHDLRDAAILVLDYWYARRGSTWDKEAPHIAEEILVEVSVQLEAVTGDTELADLAYEVGRALRDVEARLEGESE